MLKQLQQLKYQIEQYQATAATQTSCKGAITENGGGTATVALLNDGKLFVSCE
jgi:hypothetical protein